MADVSNHTEGPATAPASGDGDGGRGDEVLRRALDRGRARAAQILSVLEPWVRENSYSTNVAGVDRVADLLARDFAIPGLALERHPRRDVGDHLVWRTPGWDARPDRRIVLIGHHDTVFPPGVFDVWERDGDILRGPGVLDMKGGLATIRAALAALADIGALADLPVAVVSVSDEEIGSLDSRALLEDVARGAACALVFEAGRAGDAIITRRKGTGRVTVRARGRAAHAGNNHADGINAIWALARVIDRAQAITDYDRGVTVNTGLVTGGTSANTVPERAECTIDFRFARADDGDDAVARILGAAMAVAADTGAEIAVDGGIRRQPLERSEASAALRRAYAACARAAGLGDGESGLLGGGSDANTVSAIGVPAIDGLGPRGRGFHTTDEHIEISTLAQRVDALIRFLLAGPPA